jgi:hypothetical protein
MLISFSASVSQSKKVESNQLPSKHSIFGENERRESERERVG